MTRCISCCFANGQVISFPTLNCSVPYLELLFRSMTAALTQRGVAAEHPRGIASGTTKTDCFLFVFLPFPSSRHRSVSIYRTKDLQYEKEQFHPEREKIFR